MRDDLRLSELFITRALCSAPPCRTLLCVGGGRKLNTGLWDARRNSGPMACQQLKRAVLAAAWRTVEQTGC